MQVHVSGFREKQDLDDDEIELNEEETVGSQIDIHRKNTIRLNTMDPIQEQIGEPSCQRIADVSENNSSRAQSFTSLMAYLHQEINTVSSSSRCLNTTFT